MTALKRRIVDLIGALGPIPVSDYMALCLSDPQHGYYMTRDPFGRDGDFTTAPEISQMFGELVGTWLAATWDQLGRPARPVIAEIGPGRGTLMKDMVRTLKQLAPALRESGQFFLVETSPKLRSVQGATLEGSGGRFDWVNGVDELPAAPLFIVGNELFDAIPIRQYVKAREGWRERTVDVDAEDNLVFTAGAGSLDPALLPPEAASAPNGSVVEIAPARAALMQTIGERIARHGGAGLFVDYGHARPAVGDTLQALFKHAYDDPLGHPGEADLTAHVDFAALAEAARNAGLGTQITTQGDFLLGLGLLERAGRLGAKRDVMLRDRLASEVERLAAPDAMGKLFKVLGIGPSGTSLPGFPPAD